MNILNKDSNLKIYLYDLKGIEKCIFWFKNNVDIYWFFKSFINDNLVLIEKFYKLSGFDILFDNLISEN